jgi:hypothetical protein
MEKMKKRKHNQNQQWEDEKEKHNQINNREDRKRK